jgi:DNA-binding GntR family transcriptional regulator
MTVPTQAGGDDPAGRYLTPLTKTELAYRQIRREIVEGVLRPGMILDQEALADRLGLSTTPVREALRLLESEALVINRRHRNTVVAPLDLLAIEEAYAVRLVLDPLAVGLAAENASDLQREEIRALAFGPPEAEPGAALYANRKLHRAMYAASGNSVLTVVLDSLWDRSDRYRMVILHSQTRAQVADDEHHAIVSAVLARDVEKASALMREHVGESLHRVGEQSGLGGVNPGHPE